MNILGLELSFLILGFRVNFFNFRGEGENGREGEDLWEKVLVLGRKLGVEVEKT